MNHFRTLIIWADQDRGSESSPDYWTSLDIPIGFFSTLERFFFVILVAFKVPVVAPAMITWILLKMGIDWGRIIAGIQANQLGLRSLVCLGIVGNMLSMLFALIGGLICQQGMKPSNDPLNLFVLVLALLLGVGGWLIGKLPTLRPVTPENAKPKPEKPNLTA